MTLPARPQADSKTEMTEYVLPPHANALGTVFGGQIMAWVDLCAAMCAMRHAGKMCVTALVDDMKFEQPVRVGDVVHLRAEVTATFRTSLEIAVTVEGENATTRKRWPCVQALLTFVAIEPDGTPSPVPQLVLDSPALRASQDAGLARREARLAKRA